MKGQKGILIMMKTKWALEGVGGRPSFTTPQFDMGMESTVFGIDSFVNFTHIINNEIWCDDII